MSISSKRFEYTGAVQPVVPFSAREGYSFREVEVDHETTVPAIYIASSRDKLFELFMDVVDLLGNSIDVILESYHRQKFASWERDSIDSVVFRSRLYDYERLLLNDGRSCVIAISADDQNEVCLSEDKLIYIYGELKKFTRTLDDHGLQYDENLKMICDVSRRHHSYDTARCDFRNLTRDIGAEREM